MIELKGKAGEAVQLEAGQSGFDLLKKTGAKGMIALKLNGKLQDLAAAITEPGEFELIGLKTPEGEEILRHSTSHIMADAVQKLFPSAKVTIGPAIENGFYYDFDYPPGFKEEDLAAIEAKMKEIVKSDVRFARSEMKREDAVKLFEQKGEKYKVELINDLPEGSVIFIYQSGDFVDLCRGPHIPSTRYVKAYKLVSVAGAYWRGNEKNPQLQRIYGTAFADQEALDAYLQRLEEAKKRDHRRLGPQLGLFTLDDAVGSGLVLWKPKGTIIRNELQKFISEHLRRQGYSQVCTPHIGRLGLYKTSGHYPYYRESQFPPIIEKDFFADKVAEGCTCAQLANLMENGEIDGYLLKPMNCPMHIKIFASDHHSYRDLPVRLAEFGTVYRWEKSGELGGMTRVRGFTQDDAHLFVTEDQLPAEIEGCLELVKIVLTTLGISEYRVRVGLREPDSNKYAGTPEQWDKAEKACLDAAKTLGVAFTAEPGDAVFYGPKIDFVVKDVIGREWQLGTVQVDYQLPQRFDLSYTGADNKPHRPVMIHRAPFGSMERFVGVLIEHFAGAFPLWLSPVQVAVLSISEKFEAYAVEVTDALKIAGIRAESDLSAEKIGAKIRSATLAKAPYMLVVGQREQAERAVSVRTRTGGDQGSMPLEAFIKRCGEEIASRSLTIGSSA